MNSNRNWVINGLLDHFPCSVHHTSTDPAFLTQLKKKERVSGGEVRLRQDKPAESLKEIYGILWPQQRSVTSTSSFAVWEKLKRIHQLVCRLPVSACDYCYVIVRYDLLLLLEIEFDICLSNSLSKVSSLLTKTQVRNLLNFLPVFSSPSLFK